MGRNFCNLNNSLTRGGETGRRGKEWSEARLRVRDFRPGRLHIQSIRWRFLCFQTVHQTDIFSEPRVTDSRSACATLCLDNSYSRRRLGSFWSCLLKRTVNEARPLQQWIIPWKKLFPQKWFGSKAWGPKLWKSHHYYNLIAALLSSGYQLSSSAIFRVSRQKNLL